MTGEVRTGATLGPLRWWHIEQLLPIEADLFGVEQWSPGMFWNELANGHHYLVALADGADGGKGADGANGPGCGEVVGYAGMAELPPSEIWINNIAVRRDYQRHGIGRALLEALLAEAGRRGIRHVLLEVAVDNVAAQRLYTGYGFQRVGLRRGYYQPSNTDALVMERDSGEENNDDSR